MSLRILITNDDGINAPGLAALERALGPLGEVYVSAPLNEQSGTSRGITLRRPLRIQPMGERRYAVDGSPADSVMVAVCLLLDPRPDLVVSGVNFGPNLGENVYYSGTVAGAAEGAKYGIPAIAVSIVEREELHLAPAAEFAARLVRQVADKGLPAGVALNVNFPHPDYQGVEVTRQSLTTMRNSMVEVRDPRGRPYYWMYEEIPVESAEPGSDFAAIREGRISGTPCRFDHTAPELIPSLRSWFAAPGPGEAR